MRQLFAVQRRTDPWNSVAVPEILPQDTSVFECQSPRLAPCLNPLSKQRKCVSRELQILTILAAGLGRLAVFPKWDHVGRRARSSFHYKDWHIDGHRILQIHSKRILPSVSSVQTQHAWSAQAHFHPEHSSQRMTLPPMAVQIFCSVKRKEIQTCCSTPCHMGAFPGEEIIEMFQWPNPRFWLLTLFQELSPHYSHAEKVPTVTCKTCVSVNKLPWHGRVLIDIDR